MSKSVAKPIIPVLLKTKQVCDRLQLLPDTVGAGLDPPEINQKNYGTVKTVPYDMH